MLYGGVLHNSAVCRSMQPEHVALQLALLLAAATTTANYQHSRTTRTRLRQRRLAQVR